MYGYNGSRDVLFNAELVDVSLSLTFKCFTEKIQIFHAVALIYFFPGREFYTFRRVGGVLRVSGNVWKIVSPQEDFNILDYMPEGFRL